MPKEKNKTNKTIRNKSNKGMDPWVIPGLPKARDRSKEMVEKRRSEL